MRTGPHRRVVSNLLFLAPVAFLLVMGWAKRWVFEDAFLNFRIVDQMRAGRGPVFNIGERVEVATSTAWLAILFVLRSILPFVEIEWLSIGAGLLLTSVGLWLALLASRRLWSREGGETGELFVPFGALAYAVLPATWDWATSGLENGLSIAWIGATAFVLCTYAAGRESSSARGTVLAGVVLGFGILVRPDLAIMSVIALLAVVWVKRPHRGDLAKLLVGAVALPAMYQVFRAGYYGTLVPNTALAKNASSIYWSDGWNLFLDFVEPYWLIVPIAIVVAGGIIAFRQVPVRPPLAAVLALPVAGVLHALYIIAIGGDYIHARLLLPSLFAILVPVMAVPCRRWIVVPVVAMGAWAIVTGGWLRIEHRPEPFLSSTTTRYLLDAPAQMRWFTETGHDPILASDFDLADGPIARKLQAQGARALVTGTATGNPPLLDATPDRTTLISVASGVSGYRAGVDVIVQEAQSLADPYGSRMPAISRSLAGHRKRESWEWMIAMRTVPGVTAGYDSAEIDAARRALRCGAAAGLDRATTAPLTVDRFWSNLVGSIGRTRLVIARNPFRAERELCDRREQGSRAPTVRFGP